MFEINNIIFRPHLEIPRGFLVETKIKVYTKLTVVMFCQICDRSSVAPSSGDFCRRLQVTAGAAGGGVAAW